MNSSAVSLYFFRTRKLQLFLIWVTIVVSVASFYIMNGFIDNLKLRLFHSARNISSGDIKIQAFQKMKPEWDQEIEKIIQKKYLISNMLNFPNMIKIENGNSFLVSIKAVDEFYPFYGTIKLRNQNYEPLKSGEAYLAQEAADRFGIKIGEQLILGSQNIVIKGFLEEIPDQGFTGSSGFSPVMLMRIDNAQSSGLLQYGSRVSYIKLYKAIDSSITQEKIEKDAEAIESKLGSEILGISTWKDSQNTSRSLFDRLGSYFNILSYTAVILSSIGFYLGLSAFIMKISKEGSLLYVFGVSKNRLKNSLFFLLFSLILVGCITGLLFGLWGQNYLISQTDDIIVSTATYSLNFPLILYSLLFCLITSIFIVKISIKQFLNNLNPLDYNLSFSQNYFSIKGFILYILIIFHLLTLFSWYQSGVLLPSFSLNGMILLLLLFIFGFIWSVIIFLKTIFKLWEESPTIYMASIEFFRNKKQHLPGLVGLVFSSVLVLGIISARDSLKQKLTINDQGDLANIFMMDVQKSQLPEVQSLIDSDIHYRNFNYSPLIRARLTHINGIYLEELKRRTKEKGNMRKLNFLTRSYNLTYKDKLNASEKIKKGEFWQAGYEGPGISLESEFAKDMNMKMGDTIGFDLAGIPLEGVVTSIREIDWSSLLPNFFVIFPQKKLENAPQFIIGSARVDETQLARFQNQLVDKFPNISVMELSNIFKKIRNLFEKVLKVIVVSSALCIIASLVIMFSTLIAGEEDIQKRSHLLRSSGMNTRNIFLVSFFEKTFYFVTLICSVFVLHLIWNQLISNWMQEPKSFHPMTFGIYSLIMLVLVFSPLIFNWILQKFHSSIES